MLLITAAFQIALSFPLRISSTDISLDMVKKYAPAAKFHRDERQLPCSIEYLLQNSNFSSRTGTFASISNATQDDLFNHPDDQSWIKINVSQWGGQPLPQAPMYYAVQEDVTQLYIHYLFLYAKQGGQTLRFGGKDIIIDNVGAHEGDLEHFLITLSKKDQTILEVGFEKHGEMVRYKPGDVAWMGNTHAIVSVALNGHASYNQKAVGDTSWERDYPVVKIGDFLEDNDDLAMWWHPWNESDFKLLGLDQNGSVIGDQKWATFAGRLGDSYTTDLNGAVTFDNKPLDGGSWAAVKTTWALVKPLLGEDFTKADGPYGPGSSYRHLVTPLSIPTEPLLYVFHQDGVRKGEIWYSTFNGTSWSSDQKVEDYKMASGTSPSLVFYKEYLYCIHQGSGGGDLWYTPFSSTKWNMDTLLTDGTKMSQSASPVVYNDNIYVFHQGSGRNGDVWYHIFDGTTWQPAIQLSNTKIALEASPAAVVFNNKIYVFHLGSGGSGDLWYNVLDNTTWLGDTLLTDGTKMSQSISAVVYKNYIYVFHQGSGQNGDLWYHMFDGTTWQPAIQLANTKMSTDSSPSAVVFNDKIYVFHQGSGGSGDLWYNTLDGTTWLGDTLVTNGMKLSASPAAIVIAYNSGR
ncbi:hypothetical protein HK104_007317 [Borealophlyctis nickersoniae]|nr:hypothetical protein HK104_007317 [Borealophlyctis nickersoniae]